MMKVNLFFSTFTGRQPADSLGASHEVGSLPGSCLPAFPSTSCVSVWSASRRPHPYVLSVVYPDWLWQWQGVLGAKAFSHQSFSWTKCCVQMSPREAWLPSKCLWLQVDKADAEERWKKATILADGSVDFPTRCWWAGSNSIVINRKVPRFNLTWISIESWLCDTDPDTDILN